MARNRNKGLQRAGQQQPAQAQGGEQAEAISPDMVLPPANVPLINAQIVQILIQNNNPEEVRRLMEADLDYNKQRLAIIREHVEQHPDAVDARKTRTAHRRHYAVLMLVACALLAAIPFVSGFRGLWYNSRVDYLWYLSQRA